MRQRLLSGQAAGAVFIAPAAVVFAVFLLFPTLAVFALTLTRWTGFNLSQIRWTGTTNFHLLIHDPIFLRAFLHTLIFVVFSTIGLNIVGLTLALLVYSRVRGHEFLRVAVFVPLVISPVVTAVIWQRLLGTSGFVNEILRWLGLVRQPLDFFSNSALALATVIVASIWQYSGINMILYYAGLQGLPVEQLEAARIDGAPLLQQVRYIVMPYLRPIVAVAVVVNLIGGWKVFDIVYVMTQGGPNHDTEVLSTWLYQQAFTFNSIGYASVLAIVIIICAVVSSLARRPIRGELT